MSYTDNEIGEFFEKGIVVYSSIETKETYCETWGASTKHPDTRAIYNDWELAGKGFVDKSHPIDIIQWLMHVVSNISCMPWSLKEYIHFVSRMYDDWMEGVENER